MISERMEEMVLNGSETLIKPASEVAVVGSNNTLNHALLLMTSNKYSVVPVIGEHSRLEGLISTPLIMQAIIDIDDVNFDKLADITVKEVMKTEYPVLTTDYELEDVLHMLIDTAFISVIDDDGVLQGIITRQEALTGLNHIVHNFETIYDVKDREAEEAMS